MDKNNNTSENVDVEKKKEEEEAKEEEAKEEEARDEVVREEVVREEEAKEEEAREEVVREEVVREEVVREEGEEAREEVVREVGFRRRLRNYLVDSSVGMVKRSGIPLNLACLILKIFHFRLPFDLILYAWLGNVFTGLCLWIFVMTVFSFFLLLDGCVLSVIEYKLTGNSLNVMDVFLWLGGYELNYTNRYYATIIAAVIYLSLFFGVVFYRGGFSSDNINKLLYYLTFSYLSF